MFESYYYIWIGNDRDNLILIGLNKLIIDFIYVMGWLEGRDWYGKIIMLILIMK